MSAKPPKQGPAADQAKREGVDLDNLVLSLIGESSQLGDVLNCSLELLELFDADQIVDSVAESLRRSCKCRARIWRVGDAMPALMGTADESDIADPAARDSLMGAIMDADEQDENHVVVGGREFIHLHPFVLEVVESDPKVTNMPYIASLYLRHMVRALNSLKDRLVIAKAFNEIHEILELKRRVEGSLNDIKDQSVDSITKISDSLETIIQTAEGIGNNKARADTIKAQAFRALGETQVGDLTNQKIFASLHNLEKLFSRLMTSLDPVTKSYLDSLYSPTDLGDAEAVVSHSLMEGEARADQASVDDLLAELGL